MSTETEAALQEALVDETEKREVARKLIQENLDSIAAELPATLDGIAKAEVGRQAAVAMALGSSGIAQLRADLREVADELGADLRSAADRIEWPAGSDSSVASNQVHSALFKYLYGRRLSAVGAVFSRHGFDVRANREGSQGLVLPQSLYDEGGFGDLCKALTALSAAERVTAKARIADERSVTDALWDESGS